jgi:hypothetical protein
MMTTLFEEAIHVPLSGSSSVSQLEHSNSVRLPTIKLPKFRGNYNDWMHFKDI